MTSGIGGSGGPIQGPGGSQPSEKKPGFLSKLKNKILKDGAKAKDAQESLGPTGKTHTASTTNSTPVTPTKQAWTKAKQMTSSNEPKIGKHRQQVEYPSSETNDISDDVSLPETNIDPSEYSSTDDNISEADYDETGSSIDANRDNSSEIEDIDDEYETLNSPLPTPPDQEEIDTFTSPLQASPMTNAYANDKVKEIIDEEKLFHRIKNDWEKKTENTGPLAVFSRLINRRMAIRQLYRFQREFMDKVDTTKFQVSTKEQANINSELRSIKAMAETEIEKFNNDRDKFFESNKKTVDPLWKHQVPRIDVNNIW